MTSLHLIVREQFPEFVQDDYPVFVSFVEAYYAWMDSQVPGKLEEILDLDRTPESFVQYFRYLLDVDGLFNTTTKFNPLFLQKIKQIYTAKGSEQALTTLLKLVYNSDSIVRYPSENILKPSDGRWSQTNFITVDTTYGSLPSTVTEFFLKYDSSNVRVSCVRTEQLTATTARLYFKPNANISISAGQFVHVQNVNGNVIYAGRVIRIPVSVAITTAGSGWQLGQIITIPGTERDSVIRVAELTSNEGIRRAEILEFGTGHTENQTIIVSPYQNKPIASSYDYNVEQTSSSPIKYTHTLNLNDYLEGVIDRTVGYYDGITPNSYFLENYVERGFVSYTVFDNSTINQPIDEFETSISIEQWIESRATIVYTYGVVAQQVGRWDTSNGMLSNPDMRIQDSFYYQQYSYDVEANANSTEYINLIKEIHPCGNKLFTTYALDQKLSITPSTESSFPFIKIDLISTVLSSDSTNKLATKKFSDTLTLPNLYKSILSKKPAETLTLSDSDKETVSKKPAETLTLSDSDKETVSKKPAETLTLSDSLSKTHNKYVNDSATISSSDTSTYTITKYNVENYFGENYIQSQSNLTIGA